MLKLYYKHVNDWNGGYAVAVTKANKVVGKIANISSVRIDGDRYNTEKVVISGTDYDHGHEYTWQSSDWVVNLSAKLMQPIPFREIDGVEIQLLEADIEYIYEKKYEDE